MDKIESLLQQILENQVQMQSDMILLKTNQERLEQKLDVVVEQVADLNEFKVAIAEKLAQISKDVRFVKHKVFQNEEELFSLKEAFQSPRNTEQI